MELFIDSTLRRFFAKHPDLFDVHSTFLAWRSDENNFSWTDGHRSVAQFGRIEYRSQDGRIRHSDPLVLKCSPFKSEFKFSKDLYVLAFVNEINFYRSIWPLLRSFRPLNAESQFHKKGGAERSLLFAECYHSQLEMNADDLSGAIVLENLQAKGFCASKRRSFVDYRHLALMMRRLGEFHAHSYKARQSDPRLFESAGAALHDPYLTVWALLSDGVAKLAARGLRPLMDDAKYAGRLANAQKILENTYGYMAELSGGADARHPQTAVICHGDYLRSNVLFRYDERNEPVDLRLVDMANAKMASPVFDLALPLYLHADQGTRAQHWDDLIDEYHRSLAATFPEVRVPTRECIAKQFQNNCFHAYLIASYFLANLIAQDNNLPDKAELMPHHCMGCKDMEIPEEVIMDVMSKIGGPSADTALTDILKDMIDRGFV